MASAETPEQVIHRIAALLEDAEVPYMLTGSFASGFYGSESERQLEDAAGIMRVQAQSLDFVYI